MPKQSRFHIEEIENSEGTVVEWYLTDAEGEYDPCSFDNEQDALDELETLLVLDYCFPTEKEN